MTISVVGAAELSGWCAEHLGSTLHETLFTTGHLSYVVGVRLADGREVVVKIRQPRSELAACAMIQKSLWEAGFPCPRPLTGLHPLADGVASAEELMAGGEMLAPTAQGAVTEYAALLADLIRLAPPATAIEPFAPPPWVHWNHPGSNLWPPPDDVDADLNADAEPAWIDEIGRAVRDRMSGLDLPLVIGHADWEAQNLRWQGGLPWAVHDWDSAAILPEAALVGHAAAVWTAGSEASEPDIARSQDFLDAYQQSTGRQFSTDEIEVAWAAGLWTRAFNVKKWHRDGYSGLSRAEAAGRLHRAGC
jgi:hypothetical protein